MAKIRIEDKKLKVNGTEAWDGAEVWKTLELGDLLLVLFEPSTCKDQDHWTRNVASFDKEGNEVWRISKFAGVRDRAGCFTNIWLNEHGYLMAGNFMGFDCLVDKDTGKILNYEFTK